MRKLFFGILFLSALASGLQSPAQARVKVITTTTDLAAITREIGKGEVSVESIAKGYQDPHFVDAKPAYMVKLNQADLLITVGLELEIGWLPPLLNGARNPNILEGRSGYLDASKGIRLLEVPSLQVDRSQGDVHPFGNPHYWLDPFNGKIIAKNICEGLTRADPSLAAYFKNNLNQFDIQLDQKIREWDQRMAPYRGTKVVTYHRSWTYFASHFGFDVAGEVEPLPGIPPSPSHLAKLADVMVKEKIRMILMEPYYSDNGPEFLARNTAARVLVLPSSVGGREEIRTYFDLFDFDLGKLEEALRSAK